jgi:ATP-dependent phosphofructokinase / diphosphate-dependent phosphofructokinase
VRLSQVNFGEIVKTRLRARLSELGLETGLVATDIGYELRCADPIPWDLEYTRDLGYSAAQFVIDGGTDALITLVNGRF